ncbi:MAG: alkaline phosphatase family protein [Bacteroidia bacterium]
MKANKPKVLLIGWDAADWKTINPLMDAGYMPTLQKMMQQGSHGKLATLDPPLSPILWTSIATGKLPYKHGIHGFTEPKPDGSGIRPITNLSRKTKAFWNILSQENFKTHIVGWWPSHPAEKINGTMISNFYQRAPSLNIRDPWPLMKGSVHPEEKADFYAKLRVHPGELTEQHILPFVPRAGEIDQKTDRRLDSLAQITADCSTIQAAATHILEHEDWDVTAVYFDAIDHYCHGFMRYHPPRRPHIDEADFDLYQSVVAGGYRFHDMMLERLCKLAGPDTTVILISDHGFHADHLRPIYLPDEPAGPAAEHSPYGIICMAGPGVEAGVPIVGASLLDITPTILSLLGLPVGKDMDGKVLTNVLKNTQLPPPVLSWDQIEGDSGMHDSDTVIDAEIEAQALEQLVALGYIEDPANQGGNSVQKTINENEFYLAKSYLHNQQLDEAVQILSKLHQSDPEQYRYGLHLIHAYIQLNELKEARAIFEDLHELLTDSIDAASIHLLEGKLLLAENKTYKALKVFRLIEKEDSTKAGLNLQLGRAFSKLKKWNDALAAYNRELAIDAESASAWHGVGLAKIYLDQPQAAAEALLRAIELQYHVPEQHYYLGVALNKLEQYEVAAEAFATCLKLEPTMNQARRWLAQIYRDNLDQADKADAILASINHHVKGTITIVSGLPRAGTSMMMQMLQAGGIELYTDQQREADESNPKGYYEHEAVKRLSRDKSWVAHAEGKALKVIAQLLKSLPLNYHYKVIFMERDIREIVQSQQKMLARLGQLPENVMPYNLHDNFEKTVKEVKAWCNTQSHIEVCFVAHQDVINQPFFTAYTVNEFLGGQLALEKMTAVVNPELYREQQQSQNELR